MSFTSDHDSGFGEGLRSGKSIKTGWSRREGNTSWPSSGRTTGVAGGSRPSMENIKKDSFVVEYVGEVITSEEAEERGRKYDAEGRTYLFDLDFNLGEENIYTVDAAFYGNLSHFINHSCEPNLSIFSVYINNLDPNMPQLAMFARRDIKRGEQINYFVR